MKRSTRIQKNDQDTPIIGSKMTLHVDKRSKLRSTRSDLIDLISLNQTNLGYFPRREKN